MRYVLKERGFFLSVACLYVSVLQGLCLLFVFSLLYLSVCVCVFGESVWLLASSVPLSDDIISCRQAWVFCQCSEACVMARSQMCVQEHTVPKRRLNQT